MASKALQRKMGTLGNGSNAGPGLSTFAGVFTPSILTILGVIMYLRFGWVVGTVGLLGTLAIVTLSTLITFLTALSIAAIATSQKVRVGGAYYMISRSLGIEAGGAIGIPLYLAQALSVALYTIGFAESLVAVFPLDEKLVAIITTSLIAIIALKSTRAAIKTQYIVMAAIALSLLSLLLGSSVEEAAVVTNSLPRAGFWTVFAVFFPAVTGIMAGVNLSGDLEKPSVSIPWGTLAAIGTGYIIYMGIPLVLASRATPEQLIQDPLIMRRIAFWGDAILLGVWGATLSSALGSMLGAPRVLQALAKDGVLPHAFRILGQGNGPDDEPRIGTAVTFVIALVTVMLGNLNIVAPILTMFFLTTYGMLNISAGLERFLGNPSYRPKFRVPWIVSLLGAIGCGGVMFLINPLATGVAIGFVTIVYFWLERREFRSACGDVRRGIWLNLTRVGLMRLRTSADVKNWRPHLLVLSGAPTKRWHLIELASALSHNRTLITIASVLPSDSVTTERIRSLSSTLYDFLDRHGIQALVRLVPAATPFEGAEQLVATYGLGTVVPNTILLGDSEQVKHRQEYCRMVAHFHASKRNTVIVRYNESRGFGARRRIDVWWGGLKGNGGLMLILAYLLKTSLDWRSAELTIKMVVPTAEAAAGAASNLSEIVTSTQTGARTEILVADNRPFSEILRASSSDADLVFVGMAEPSGDYSAYYESLQERTRGLPTTILVLAGENIPFGEVML